MARGGRAVRAANRSCRAPAACYLRWMAEASPTDRIDAALARIERALAARDKSVQNLRDRHESLRARVGEAIAALDALGARNG